MKKRGGGTRLVYSTDQGRICPECGKPKQECICRAKDKQVKTDGIVRVSLDKKGRKGKGVSVISGLPLDEGKLRVLAKQLKQRCGGGGTVKDGTIEIQGDHRELLVTELTKQGYKVKLAGG
ncbi:MAG: translation initiation factor Sui1 [Desulfobulbaceae bacterium]|nr:translation initiation factor Sui1 [Desulfobulbaceae bacterium]